MGDPRRKSRTRLINQLFGRVEVKVRTNRCELASPVDEGPMPETNSRSWGFLALPPDRVPPLPGQVLGLLISGID